jgi:hypothetical protein
MHGKPLTPEIAEKPPQRVQSKKMQNKKTHNRFVFLLFFAFFAAFLCDLGG